MASGGDGAAKAEKDALQTLDELELVAALDSFRKDFERLVKTVRKARDGERESAERVAQLKADLDTKRRAKDGSEQERSDLEGAKRQLGEEVATIEADLKRLRDSSEEAKRGIEESRQKSLEMDAVINKGSGWTEEQLKERERLQEMEERGQQLVTARREQLKAVEADVDALRFHIRGLEKERAALRRGIAEVTELTELKRRETERLQSKKEEADALMKQAQAEAEALGRRQREAQAEAEDAGAAAAREQATVKSLRSRMEKLVGVYDRLHSEVGKLTSELDGEGHTNEVLARELVDLDVKLRERQEEVAAVEADTARLKAKHAKAARMIDTQAERHAAVAKQELALKEQREKLYAEASAVQAQIRSVQKEQEKRRQERELLRKAITSETDASGAIERLITEHNNAATTLKAESRGYRKAVLALRDRMDGLREERARIAAESEAAAERHMRAVAASKQAELRASQAQRRLLELRAKIRSQEHLLESVRTDRTSYSKTLRTAEGEIDSMRRQFQSTTYRIEQLKDELMAKDHKLVKEHFEFKKAEKDSERVAADLATLRQRSRNADDLLAAQEAEVVKLRRIVREAEDERGRQQKEFSAVVGERDVLQAQLVKRDAELTALYEKLKVQKSALARGATRWETRQAEQHAAVETLRELQAETELARAQVGSLEEMRREQRRLEVACDREQGKIKSLSDEMERPVNVHRWRAMQVVDPERYKLIRRSHALQRRLLEADEKLKRCDLAVQEKEGLYVELRQQMARRAGDEVDEELEALEDDMKTKQKQLRAMQEEAENQQALVSELKRELKRVKDAIRVKDVAFARTARAAGDGDADSKDHYQ